MYRLFRAYADNTSLEIIALKAAFLLPILVLQRPHNRSKIKSKSIIDILNRRMNSWLDGDFDCLMSEGRSIQTYYSKVHGKRYNDKSDDIAFSFNSLMMKGGVQSAGNLVTNKGFGKPLSLDTVVSSSPCRTVREILHDKHPDSKPALPNSVLLPTTLSPDHEPHPILFDRIDGALIHKIALQSRGSAGPSGIDAAGWKRLLSSFKSHSADLCDAIASLARRLCTSYVDPAGLSSFVACRLIALDKSPGVRPIGIGEVVRRIVGKSILSVINSDILDIAGPLQLCAGQEAGCEAAVHAIRCIFESQDTEAILLVDASNAFNCLNRETALRNTLHLCPSLGRVLINTYRSDIDLYIDGECFLSREGTTQGDPLAMAMFAVSTLPLIWELNHVYTKQVCVVC